MLREMKEDQTIVTLVKGLKIQFTNNYKFLEGYNSGRSSLAILITFIIIK